MPPINYEELSVINLPLMLVGYPVVDWHPYIASGGEVRHLE